jgi:8-oxo-dGTP diphosphatase
MPMKTKTGLTAPVVAIGAVVIHDNKVLLVKRGQPPSEGLWAIPGGKVKLGETLQQAAEREIKEETDINVSAGEPVHVFEVIEKQIDRYQFHYVIVDIVCRYISGELSPHDDALDAGWFGKNDLNNDRIDKNTQRFLQKWWDKSVLDR